MFKYLCLEYLLFSYYKVSRVYDRVIRHQPLKAVHILSSVSGIKRKRSNLIKPLLDNYLFIWCKIFKINGENFCRRWFQWCHYWEHIAFSLRLQRMNGYLLGQTEEPLTEMRAVASSLTNVAIRQVIPLLTQTCEVFQTSRQLNDWLNKKRIDFGCKLLEFFQQSEKTRENTITK